MTKSSGSIWRLVLFVVWWSYGIREGKGISNVQTSVDRPSTHCQVIRQDFASMKNAVIRDMAVTVIAVEEHARIIYRVRGVKMTTYGPGGRKEMLKAGRNVSQLSH